LLSQNLQFYLSILLLLTHLLFYCVAQEMSECAEERITFAPWSPATRGSSGMLTRTPFAVRLAAFPAPVRICSFMMTVPPPAKLTV
jgi:hypothetical protein